MIPIDCCEVFAYYFSLIYCLPDGTNAKLDEITWCLFESPLTNHVT